MQVTPALLNIHNWMKNNDVYIVDFNPFEDKMYIAIVGDNRTDDEVVQLAKQLKVMLTMTRVSLDKDASRVSVKYKTITRDEIFEVRQKCHKAFDRLTGMLERGEIVLDEGR